MLWNHKAKLIMFLAAKMLKKLRKTNIVSLMQNIKHLFFCAKRFASGLLI